MSAANSQISRMNEELISKSIINHNAVQRTKIKKNTKVQLNQFAKVLSRITERTRLS